MGEEERFRGSREKVGSTWVLLEEEEAGWSERDAQEDRDSRQE